MKVVSTCLFYSFFSIYHFSENTSNKWGHSMSLYDAAINRSFERASEKNVVEDQRTWYAHRMNSNCFELACSLATLATRSLHPAWSGPHSKALSHIRVEKVVSQIM